MTWFSSGNSPARPQPKPAAPTSVAVTQALQLQLAAFLVKNGRLEERHGHHLLRVTATTRNADGSTDYVVHTRVRGERGAEQHFDSLVRIYADNRLKLIR